MTIPLGNSLDLELKRTPINSNKFGKLFAKAPPMPVFLYGHSLGGILVLNYELRKRPVLAGVVAAGPALRTFMEESKVKVVFAKIFGSLFSRVSLSNGIDPNLLARDPDVV